MSFLSSIWAGVKRLFSSLAPNNRPLCDTCRYDYESACRNPERPNALRCDEYKRR